MAFFWWTFGTEEKGKISGGLRRENSLSCLLTAPVALQLSYRLALWTRPFNCDLHCTGCRRALKWIPQASCCPNTLLKHLNLLIKGFHLLEKWSMIWPNLIFVWIWLSFHFPFHKERKRKEKGRKAAYVISLLPSETAKLRANLFSLIHSRFLKE